MEDKTFELLEKMYSEFLGFRKDTNDRFDELESKIENNHQNIVKIQTNLEQAIQPKVQLALEKLDMVNSKLEEYDDRLGSLEDKVDVHNIELSVLKRDR